MANKRKAKIEDCKLLNLRLLESSSKLFNPELRSATLDLSMSEQGSFLPASGEEGIDFYLDITVDITAREIGNENEDGLLANVSGKFRADFMINSDEKNPEQYRKMAELIGRPLYPAMRQFFTNMFLVMGIPIDIPWSLSQRNVAKSQENTEAGSR